MERHFPIKSGQPIEMALLILNFVTEFLNKGKELVCQKWSGELFQPENMDHLQSRSEETETNPVSWKSRNSAGIFKGLFFVNSKRLKSSQRFSEVRIFSEDDPRATEVSQISPTNNRTAEGNVSKIFVNHACYRQIG